MKLFNNFSISWLLAAIIMLLMVACSESKDGTEPSADPNSVKVEISTEVITQANVTTELVQGDKMNIYAKTYNSVESPDLVSNVMATRNGTEWEISPEIRLVKGGKVFLYAVAPYDAAYTNPAAIPVDLSKQLDLLYSGAYVPATFNTHSVKLNMKHALTLASYNILKQNYSGAGKLTSLTVAGDPVFSNGTMNVSTGAVTGSEKTGVSADFNVTATAQGWTSDIPSLWVIPFSTKVQKASLTAVIDGKSYTIDIPEVEMKAGFQFIFRLTLTDLGLEFVPNLTEQRSLNVTTDSVDPLEGYGVLAFSISGDRWAQPAFTGDNVFGSLNWGADGCTYKNSAEIVFGDGAANRNVVVETWNSTGIELPDLVGVEGIDLTQY